MVVWGSVGFKMKKKRMAQLRVEEKAQIKLIENLCVSAKKRAETRYPQGPHLSWIEHEGQTPVTDVEDKRSDYILKLNCQ